MRFVSSFVPYFLRDKKTICRRGNFVCSFVAYFLILSWVKTNRASNCLPDVYSNRFAGRIVLQCFCPGYSSETVCRGSKTPYVRQTVERGSTSTSGSLAGTEVVGESSMTN